MSEFSIVCTCCDFCNEEGDLSDRSEHIFNTQKYAIEDAGWVMKDKGIMCPNCQDDEECKDE